MSSILYRHPLGDQYTFVSLRLFGYLQSTRTLTNTFYGKPKLSPGLANQSTQVPNTLPIDT